MGNISSRSSKYNEVLYNQTTYNSIGKTSSDTGTGAESSTQVVALTSSECGTGVESSTRTILSELEYKFSSDTGSGVESSTKEILSGPAAPYLPMTTSRDIDDNGVIMPTDRIAIFLRCGTSYGDPTYDVRCDLNYDGDIDADDLAIYDDAYLPYVNLTDIRDAVRNGNNQDLTWPGGFNCRLVGCDQDGIRAFAGGKPGGAQRPAAYISVLKHLSYYDIPPSDVLNPSFESWDDDYTPTSWNTYKLSGLIEKSSEQVKDGNYSCKLTTQQAGSAYAKVAQEAIFGGTYMEKMVEISFWYYLSATSSNKLNIQIDFGFGQSEVHSCPTTSVWAKFLEWFQIPSDAIKIDVNIWLEGDTGGAYTAYVDLVDTRTSFSYACSQFATDTALASYKALGYGHLVYAKSDTHAYNVFWVGGDWQDLNNWRIFETLNGDIELAVDGEGTHDTNAIWFYDYIEEDCTIHLYTLTVDTPNQTVAYGSSQTSGGAVPYRWHFKETPVYSFDKYLGVGSNPTEPYLSLNTSLDINGDGTIGDADRSVIAALQGTSYSDRSDLAYNISCDLNYDGVIDSTDIAIFDAAYLPYSNLIDIRTDTRNSGYQTLDWGDGFTCALQGCNDAGVEAFLGKHNTLPTLPQIGFVSTGEHLTVYSPSIEILNPSFELWDDEYTPTDWNKELNNGVVQRNDVEVQHGSYSCKLTTSQVAGAYARVNQDVTFNGAYTERLADIRFYYYLPSGSGNKLKVQVDYGTSLSDIESCVTENYWVHFLGRFIVPYEATQLNLKVWVEGDDSGAYTAYIDNASATYNFTYACYERSIDAALGAYKALGYGHIMTAWPTAVPHAYCIFWTGVQPWQDLNNWKVVEPGTGEIIPAVNEFDEYETNRIVFFDDKTLASNIRYHLLTVDYPNQTVSYGSSGQTGDSIIWRMRETAVDTFDKFLGQSTEEKTSSDVGTGTEHILDRDIVLTQTGTGLDASHLSKDITGSDTGTGVENSYLHVIAEVKTSSDSGAGSESSDLLMITDKTSSDSGSGSESSAISTPVTSSDSGAGAESSIAGKLASDTGECVEAVMAFLRDGAGDSGSGDEDSVLVGSAGRLMKLVTDTGLKTS